MNVLITWMKGDGLEPTKMTSFYEGMNVERNKSVSCFSHIYNFKNSIRSEKT